MSDIEYKTAKDDNEGNAEWLVLCRDVGTTVWTVIDIPFPSWEDATRHAQGKGWHIAREDV